MVPLLQGLFSTPVVAVPRILVILFTHDCCGGPVISPHKVVVHAIGTLTRPVGNQQESMVNNQQPSATMSATFALVLLMSVGRSRNPFIHHEPQETIVPLSRVSVARPPKSMLLFTTPPHSCAV
jgi:hypothetical protein